MQQHSTATETREKALYSETHGLQFLVGYVLLPVWGRPDSLRRRVVVQNCTPSIVAAVAVNVGGVDGTENRTAILLSRNGTPPLQIPLELSSALQSSLVRYSVPAEFGANDVVELAQVKPCSWYGQAQKCARPANCANARTGTERLF